MNLTLNYYNKKYPLVGDIVFITMGEPDKGIVPCKIFEYPFCTAIIQTAHLTKRKRVKSIRSFLSQSKPVPAEVIESDDKMVSLSIKFITKDDRNNYNKDYSQRIKLLNMLTSIKIESDNEFNDLVQKIIYPLNEILPADNKFNYLENNYQTLDYDNLFGNVSELFKLKLFTYFKTKPKKISKEFSVISLKGISTTKEMFKLLKEKQPDFKPKLLNTPNFIIEITDIEEKATKKIENFLKDLTEISTELAINIKY